MPPKYHLTASAHKHDLLVSLRKNEFYHLPEFYIRARAWYKAEIDRHLSALSASDHSSVEQARLPVRHHQGASASDSPTTRRIQPPRSAKHLAAPPSDLARSRSGTTKRSRNGNGVGNIISAQKTGDYTLPSEQFKKFLVLQKDSSEEQVLLVPAAERRSPRDRDLWDGTLPVLPGIHVAYFMLGLEGAVEFKMLELLKNNHSHNGADTTKVGEGDKGKKCLLEMKKYKYKQGFKPAWEVEEPGEEWRLIRDVSSPDSSVPGDDAGLGIGEEEDKLATTTGDGKGAVLPSSVLARKVGNVRDLKVMVESREERSRTGTPAPVAEMQLSPTLGRWHLDGVGDMGGGKMKRKKMKKESLDGKIVETELGLRFAVDLCEAVEGRRVKDGVRILMV